MGAEQKVVIITGASQGIGAELVKGYRDRNYRVVANSRAIKPSSDPDVLTVAGDIADPRTAERMGRASDRALRPHRQPGQQRRHLHRKALHPLYRRGLRLDRSRINLGELLQLTRRVAAEMLKQGSGHIVQITTSLVDHANSNVPSVLASLTKGGLNAATKSLAIEYAKKRHPGERGLARRHQDADACSRNPRIPGNLHPVGRMGEARDIVDAVLFLETACFVTGEILHVDGGQSAGR